MSNPLTGDYEAVLQVSGATIDRLMASLHQNAATKPHLPSHPHSLSFRIGDTHRVLGVQGRVDAQAGAPRVRLIHGATDRFELEVDVRARYRSDAGTVPMPECIHGVVRAQYRIHQIDPSCTGWRRRAGDYFWVRVVKDTVRFTGTAVDDVNVLTVSLATAIVDEQEVLALITRQIAALLAARFEAAPHRLTSTRFRAGAMRSLSAAIGGDAVAVPLSLSDQAPQGALASVNNIFLAGSDFAVAIRLEVLMAEVEPTLAQVRAFSRGYRTTLSPFIGPDTIINHRAHVTSATATWEATGGDHGVLRIRASGVVDSDSLLAPSITFSVDQLVVVSFDAGLAALTLSALAPGVSVKATGVFATQDLVDKVQAAIKSAVTKETGKLAGRTIPVGNGHGEMVTQLKTLDDQADAWFDHGVFTPHGVVLHGGIGLSPRRKPVVEFARLADDSGYSALTSWMPGGRIDRFRWTWSWTVGKASDSSTRSDRFILRRPRAKRSPWGGTLFDLQGSEPLPGLDGFGSVCLTIEGVYVHAVTGQLVPFTSARRCRRFGANIGISRADGIGPLIQRLWPEVRTPGPPVELGVMDLGGEAVDPETATNTLVVHTGRHWDPGAAETFVRALEASRRRDAGLVLLVVVDEGALQRDARGVVEEIEGVAARAGAVAQVVEDIDTTWSARLGRRSEAQAWRLFTPAGGMSWMHDGRLDPERLARALDDHLVPSPPARPVLVTPFVEPGAVLTPIHLRPVATDVESTCPPPPISQFGVAGSVVAFVRAGAPSSRAQLRDLERRLAAGGENAPAVVAIVEGSPEAAEEVAEAHPTMAVLADPEGHVSRRFGVRIWPTTLGVDGQGMVTSLVQGLDIAPPPESRESSSPSPEEC